MMPSTIEEVISAHTTQADLDYWEKHKPKEMSRSQAVKMAKAKGWNTIRDGEGMPGADPYWDIWKYIENEKHECIIYENKTRKAIQHQHRFQMKDVLRITLAIGLWYLCITSSGLLCFILCLFAISATSNALYKL